MHHQIIDLMVHQLFVHPRKHIYLSVVDNITEVITIKAMSFLNHF